MDVRKQEAGLPGLEGGEVRRPVERHERLADLGGPDGGQLARREADLADLLERAHLAAVVQERHPLVVAGGVREEGAIVLRQVRLDGAEADEVVAHLLEGDELEPADHRGEQLVILVAPLVRAEAGDVPACDEEAAPLALRDLRLRAVSSAVTS